MKPKVYVTQAVSENVKSYLESYFDLETWEKKESIPRETLLQKLKDVNGLLNAGIPINEELLSSAPELKIVSNASVGYNNFNIEQMVESGVIGTHTPGTLDETVTDLVFGLMISTARRMVELDAYTRAGKWTGGDDSHFFGLDVFGKTMGIIGLGRIGESIAKRAVNGFNMDVLYHGRSRKLDAEQEIGITYAEMDELLSESDFIIVMTPLTKETHHLIDKKEFEKMKDTAIIINASRGPTVNEKALVDALKEKQIYGAGLDVFDQEPVAPDNPLLKLDNVVLTPHIGSATAATRERMAQVAAENLVNYLIKGKQTNVIKEMHHATQN
ncbi:D-glycerate dehydrogenase [bacterium LRH843]|nr:D-glycerate dehydrogenase [bacterium LRH843]